MNKILLHMCKFRLISKIKFQMSFFYILSTITYAIPFELSYFKTK